MWNVKLLHMLEKLTALWQQTVIGNMYIIMQYENSNYVKALGYYEIWEFLTGLKSWITSSLLLQVQRDPEWLFGQGT